MCFKNDVLLLFIFIIHTVKITRFMIGLIYIYTEGKYTGRGL